MSICKHTINLKKQKVPQTNKPTNDISSSAGCFPCFPFNPPRLLALAWLSEPQPSCASSGEHEPAMLVSLEFIRLDYIMYEILCRCRWYVYVYKCKCIWLYILLYVGLCIYLFVLLYELSMSSTCLVVTQMCLWFAISNLPEEDISYIILWDRIQFFCQQGIYVKIAETWAGGMWFEKRTFLTLQASQWTYKFPCKLTWFLSLRGSWAV